MLRINFNDARPYPARMICRAGVRAGYAQTRLPDRQEEAIPVCRQAGENNGDISK